MFETTALRLIELMFQLSVIKEDFALIEQLLKIADFSSIRHISSCNCDRNQRSEWGGTSELREIREILEVTRAG